MSTVSNTQLANELEKMAFNVPSQAAMSGTTLGAALGGSAGWAVGDDATKNERIRNAIIGALLGGTAGAVVGRMVGKLPAMQKVGEVAGVPMDGSAHTAERLMAGGRFPDRDEYIQSSFDTTKAFADKGSSIYLPALLGSIGVGLLGAGIGSGPGRRGLIGAGVGGALGSALAGVPIAAVTTLIQERAREQVRDPETYKKNIGEHYDQWKSGVASYLEEAGKNPADYGIKTSSVDYKYWDEMSNRERASRLLKVLAATTGGAAVGAGLGGIIDYAGHKGLAAAKPGTLATILPILAGAVTASGIASGQLSTDYLGLRGRK